MSSSSAFDPSSEPNSRPRRRVRRDDAKVVTMPGAAGRPLPHSLEAEESLLACCLLDGADMIPRCRTAKLIPESFYDPKHGIVLEALYALYDAQQPIEPAILAEHLKTRQLLDGLGSYAFIAQLTKRVPTTAEAAYFLEQVRTAWILRQIIRHGEKLTAETYAYAGEPLVDFLSPHVVWFETALARLSHGSRGGVFTLKKRIEAVKEDVARRAAGTEDRRRWVWTGFSAFDDVERDSCLSPLGSLGVEDGNLLIGGGSSHGKSVLLRHLADQALESGQRVLVYTLETSVEGFVRMLAAARSSVNLLALKRTPGDRLKRFEECCDELMELADKRLFVFQNEAGMNLRTIEAVATHARRFSMQHGVPHLLELDYLQLVDTEKRCNTREQQVAQVASVFQELQRELGCVTAGGAQLNEAGLREMRQVRRDENDKIIHRLPNRGDLRESQAMFHAADVAWFLYQPPEDCRGADQSDGNALTPETWIVQDKRRNGVRGVCRTWFQKQFGRFREIGADESGTAAAKPTSPAPVASGARVASSHFKTPKK
jgi:replicative DNA helicase